DQITAKFIKAFEQDRKALNALQPTYNPKVTDYMDDIISFIEDLVTKGYAYEINGDVYFRISKLKQYGQLSNLDLENLQVGARIDENKDKENPLDFTLWKKTTNGINWDSNFSKGRPGWHTECVVMIGALNNKQKIDIHGGGMDLKFPHHENEIAQSLGCYEHSLANYWMHNGFINLDDEKMSKSIGNVMWSKDVVSAIGANTFRLAMHSSHYRSPLNFNDELIKTTTKELEKIDNALKQAHLQLSLAQAFTNESDIKQLQAFIEILSDDLNTSGAITIIIDTLKLLNQQLRVKTLDYKLVASYYNSIIKMCNILGLSFHYNVLSNDDILLYQDWNNAKKEKDFTKADQLRDMLISKGII
ncbi:MAG: cysteine--tRNA ligase, partial [Bacilli bacterium]